MTINPCPREIPVKASGRGADGVISDACGALLPLVPVGSRRGRSCTRLETPLDFRSKHEGVGAFISMGACILPT